MVVDGDTVEGDEMFTINLNVPMSPGIVAGATIATATIIDTNSRLRTSCKVVNLLVICVL